MKSNLSDDLRSGRNHHDWYECSEQFRDSESYEHCSCLASDQRSCSSLSKTYSITGWRLGYVIAPERIIERVKKVHDFLTVGAAAPLMEAATVGLCFPDSYYTELQAHYTHMKQLFCDGLK